MRPSLAGAFGAGDKRPMAALMWTRCAGLRAFFCTHSWVIAAAHACCHPPVGTPHLPHMPHACLLCHTVDCVAGQQGGA